MSNVIKRYRNSLPESYLDFISREDGFSGMVGDDFNCYVDIWGKSQIDENWNGYSFSEFLDNDWFPIGSDGGGEMIAIKLTSAEQELFYLPFIGMSSEEPVYFCESFLSLLKAIRNAQDE